VNGANVTDLEKQTIVIDSDLKKELEEFNFKYRRTEHKINLSQVCREALREELEKKKRSMPGLKQKTLSEEIFQSKEESDSEELSYNIKKQLPDSVKEPEENIEKICEHCSKTYSSNNKKSMYCSDACNQAAYRKRKSKEAK
jgi:hypothetical protein